MDDSFEYKGVWQVPGPGEPIDGTLTYSRDSGPGARSIRVSPPSPDLHSFFKFVNSPEPIAQANMLHGITRDGKLVTLEHCLVVQQSVNTAGTGGTTVRIGRAYIGAHFPANETPSFNSIRVRLSSTRFMGRAHRAERYPARHRDHSAAT